MAGTIKTDVIQSELTTPTVFRNSNGTEIGQFCRVWANYNGSSATLNRSFNLSSISKSATGKYIATFAVSFVDATYSAAGSAGQTNVSYVFNKSDSGQGIGSPTSSTLPFVSVQPNTAVNDDANINFLIVR
jgi:hypothetical protein